MCRKSSKCGRKAAWMCKGFPAEFQHKQDVYGKRKHRWTAQEEYRDIASVYRAGVRKAKAHLGDEMRQKQGGYQEGFCRYRGSKRKAEEHRGLLLHGVVGRHSHKGHGKHKGHKLKHANF